MVAKRQQDISKETDKVRVAGKEASQNALEVASFAEKTKVTLEGLSGEATTEAAQVMEQASQELQKRIDKRQGEVFQESQKIFDELDEKHEGFEQAIAADKSDLNDLSNLRQEAKANGVSDTSIAQAEKAKEQEIRFLESEVQDINKTKAEMTQKIAESRQRRQSSGYKYQSKNLQSDHHSNYEQQENSQVDNSESQNGKSDNWTKEFLLEVICDEGKKFLEQATDISAKFLQEATTNSKKAQVFFTLATTFFGMNLVNFTKDIWSPLIDINNRIAAAYGSPLSENSIFAVIKDISEENEELHFGDDPSISELAGAYQEQKEKDMEEKKRAEKFNSYRTASSQSNNYPY